MKKIQNFHEIMNASIHDHTLDWSTYRKQLEKLIERILETKKQVENGLVIGFGNGYDIPLDLLLSRCESLTITDVDMKNMEHGIKKHKHATLNQKKLVIKQLEYTGLGNLSFFDRLETMLIEQRNIDEAKDYINQEIDKTKMYKWEDMLQKSYDFIFVSPIYTQLVFQQFSDLIQKYASYDALNAYFLDKMQIIIDHFNLNLVSVKKANATVLVLSDILKADKNTNYFYELLQAIPYPLKMNELYQNYLHTYGYGLGDYGLLSLDKHMSKTDEKWLLWPFNENSIMAVKAVWFLNENGNN